MMLDLLLSTAVNTAQIQLVAQSQSSTIYLSISTTQSTRPNCVTYIAKNTTGRQVRDIQVNRRDLQGKIYKSYLMGSLSVGKTIAFDMCDSSFVNVEAKQ
ncbi:MAG: hypothetical protein DCF19_21450 [Pseudanabaena frigida]|uniref:Uncharacterized protein n=1 Tax=Pseudanabaena frigida TaxID=945775 RepID=A0A2W4W336_9CYAN|nr:MAG: hypothetical protein DCF19_21450 [Pseudanabaena frigida]